MTFRTIYKLLATVILIFSINSCASINKTNKNTLFKPAIKKPFAASLEKQPPSRPQKNFAITTVNNHLTTKTTFKKINSHPKISDIATVSAANKKSLQTPNSLNYFNATMIYDFIPGELYRIYCAPLNITDIQFDPDEQIIAIAAGDTMRWQISKTFSGSNLNRHEHLLIKPSSEGLNNSIVITTTLRTYHLLLLSTKNTSNAAITWRYPNKNYNFVHKFYKSPKLFTNKQDTESISSISIDHLDFNYAVQLIKGKEPNWFPCVVFNDGNKTYIKFNKHVENAPILFIGNTANTVNYHVRGNYYIVDSVFKQAQLRLGQNHPTIVQINHDIN